MAFWAEGFFKPGFWVPGFWQGMGSGDPPPDPPEEESFMFTFGISYSYITINFGAPADATGVTHTYKRTDPNQPPVYTYSKNNADTINILVSIDGVTFHQYATHGSGTTTGGGSIIGRWNYIKVTKGGTGGVAQVVITV